MRQGREKEESDNKPDVLIKTNVIFLYVVLYVWAGLHKSDNIKRIVTIPMLTIREFQYLQIFRPVKHFYPNR
jgi:hypothetical protein